MNTHDIDNDYDNDPDFGYDPALDDLTDDEAVTMLVEEGYSEEEAKRMVGLYDADDEDTNYGFDDLDRDVPDYVDDEDFE
jgi:hypothetical protein